MVENKEFRTLILGSIACDRMLCQASIGDIHEVVTHLVGHPVWTHEITLYADAAKVELLAQFPEMPATSPEDWQACADALVARYGEMLVVRQGTGTRDSSPMETLRQVMPHAEVIVVETNEDAHD